MIELAQPSVVLLGVTAVCLALGLSRATWYRLTQSKDGSARTPQTPALGLLPVVKTVMRRHPRALSQEEEDQVLNILHEPRFQDKAPAQVYATLLDEGTLLCSTRTFYRILHKHDEVHERRHTAMRPRYQRPELLASGPNQLWSWDITLLRGPQPGTYYYLYVMIDVFSRYAVGWMLAEQQNAAHATRFIKETCKRQGIQPRKLTIHSDRGAPMTADTTAGLLRRLEIKQTLSRPRVSDDNPYSESQFKTLKYRPDFPNRFDSLEGAHSFLVGFFKWYNEDHCHSGLALLPPSVVHHGRSEEVLQKRDAVLLAAFERHPERFVGGVPRARRPPAEVWINPPKKSSTEAQAGPPGCSEGEPQGSGDAVPELVGDLR